MYYQYLPVRKKIRVYGRLEAAVVLVGGGTGGEH
jgi:hypothetical protein